MTSIDDIAAAIASGTPDTTQQAVDQLFRGLAYLAATARGTADTTDDRALAEYLRGKAEVLDETAEELAGRTPRWLAVLSDGREVRVTAPTVHSARQEAECKARGGRFARLFDWSGSCPVTSIARIA